VGTFLFVGGQRGFTLVELVVAVGIVALLAVAATLTLALRPGALRASVASFDASFAAARAIATTSGNGATIVVAPRSDARGRLPGFIVRIYRGRPTSANAVTLADLPAIVADADVREATLGAPPFAIFLSSAGNASGLAAYPAFAGDGTPQFAPVASQPPCPAGGLSLTFSSAHGSQTRVLACGARAFGSPLPLATESPAPILLTPKALVFYWPTAPAQTFVATEWGYTRWFAADAFGCGSNVAQLPQNDPAPPYSPPHSPEDASSDPLAPAGLPVSYADAPDSMQDAPARFPLSPVSAGVCATEIADAFGQKATMRVHVMGRLTATPSSISWASTDGSPQTVSLSKTYDHDKLSPTLTASTCSGIATAAINGTALQAANIDSTPTIRNVTITPVQNNGVNVGGSCAFTFASQYAGEPPVTVSINVAAGSVAIAVSPIAVQYPVSGGTLTAFAPHRGMRHDAGAWFNLLLGGGIAVAANVPCQPGQARAFLDTAMTAPDESFGQTGCYDGHIVASEPGYVTPSAFHINTNVAGGCMGAQIAPGSWSPNASGQPASAGGQVTLSIVPQAPTAGCVLEITDDTGHVASHYGDVTVAVVGCTGTSGTLPTGDSCTPDALPPDDNGNPESCDPTLGLQGTPSTHYFYSLGQGKFPVNSNAWATLGGGGVTRTAPGTFDLYIVGVTTTMTCTWNARFATWQVGGISQSAGTYETIVIN